jgi:hypothetical protein
MASCGTFRFIGSGRSTGWRRRLAAEGRCNPGWSISRSHRKDRLVSVEPVRWWRRRESSRSRRDRRPKPACLTTPPKPRERSERWWRRRESNPKEPKFSFDYGKDFWQQVSARHRVEAEPSSTPALASPQESTPVLATLWQRSPGIGDISIPRARFTAP